MFNYNDFKLAIENNIYPSYILDVKNEKIMHANTRFMKVFKCDIDIYNKKFYDAIDIDMDSFRASMQNIADDKSFEFSVNYKTTASSYTCLGQLVGDGDIAFCELKSCSGEICENNFENAMSCCIDIYKENEEPIDKFMELLGVYYGCRNVSAYRYTSISEMLSCISQWGEDLHLHDSEDMSSKSVSDFIVSLIKSSNKSGVVFLDSESEDFDENSIVAKILEHYKVSNFALCAIEDSNNKLVGMISLTNIKNIGKEFDNRLVNTVSRFIMPNIVKTLTDEILLEVHNKDTLTGLPNRVGYSKFINNLVENLPKSIGVIFANVNGLKYINEKLGVGAGDDLIKHTAQQLKNYFKFEVFRMAGDEFVGLAINMEKDFFETKVTDMLTNMKNEGNMDFSLGYAYESGKYSLSKLLQEAEAKMYINKQEYYSNNEYVSDKKYDLVRDNMLNDLLSYIKNDEFMIYLQPQVRLEDSSLYGAEALIRRFDKTNQKMVFPDQFIPMYEQKSIIRHVDLFVVDTVCKLLKEWSDEGKAIPISVNLSRVTLQEFGIVEKIVEICQKYNVDHKLLVIEVTERVGLIENNVPSALITSFKKHGFNISLDDFGCAYSNIVTLAQIDVDEVKIDKSLVDDLTTKDKNRVLVKNVLSMCNELNNTSTLAEGIEDEQQAKLLYELGCHLGQGYFYSRPVPIDEFYQKYM